MLSVYTPINFLMSESIFMKLGMYISLCVYMCILPLASQRLGRNVTGATNTHATVEEL
jgi:hypothetical protein